MRRRPTTRPGAGRLAALALVALCVAGAAGAVGSAAGAGAGVPASADTASVDARSSPAFVVSLYGNGSATVSVVYTFDLTTESEAAAFEQIRTDETVLSGYENRTTTRLQRVADAAEAATGREMSVSAASATVRRVDSTGVVQLSVTWTGLAAVDGDRLAVTEPFASGFAPDRPFVVVPPDGYVLAETTVAPTSTGDGEVRWAAGTNLTGFEATFVPSEDATATPTTAGGSNGGDGSDSGDGSGGDADSDGSDGDQSGGTSGAGPGFGVAAAVAGVVAAALGRAAVRR